MYDNDDEKPLIIPENCPPVVYPVLNGYTAGDMKYVAIVTMIAIVIAILQYIRNGNVFISLGIVIFCAAVAIILRGRDRYSENFMDKLRISNEYRTSKKHFIYEKNRYGEELGNE